MIEFKHGQTMTVGELIEMLEQFDVELPVFGAWDGGISTIEVAEESVLAPGSITRIVEINCDDRMIVGRGE